MEAAPGFEEGKSGREGWGVDLGANGARWRTTPERELWPKTLGVTRTPSPEDRAIGMVASSRTNPQH